MFKKVKSILVFVLLLTLIFSASCSLVEKENQKTQYKTGHKKYEVKKNDSNLSYDEKFIPYDEKFKVSYIDYSDFFIQKGEGQVTTGKYSNTTYDGRIKWDIDTLKIYGSENKKNIDLDTAITLNGKMVKMPINFEDLGVEYSDFSNIDYDKVEQKKPPYSIVNKKYGTTISVIDTVEGNEDLLLAWLIDKNGHNFSTIEFDKNTGKIVTVIVADFEKFDMLDIRVNGIKVGSTLNEMYDELGTPTLYEPAQHMVMYTYKEDGVKRFIGFCNYKQMYDYREGKKVDVKQNTITSLILTIEE